MKTCPKCEAKLVIGKNITEANARVSNWVCNTCRSKLRKARYKAKKDIALAQSCKWKKENAVKVREDNRALRARSATHRRDYNRIWYAKNPGRKTAQNAKHRAVKLKQTPPWFCKKTVDEIYAVAQEFGYEVDHIIPLSKGGLHSHENLQLLTFEENRSKSARDY